MNCKKCKKTYSTSLYSLPRILISCGHSLCQRCIELNLEYQKNNLNIKEILCIQCNKVSYGNNYQSFPINATLLNLINNDDICKIHRLKYQAYCQKDHQLLCVSCIISNQHKSHKIVPIHQTVQKDRSILIGCYQKIQQSKQLLQKYQQQLSQQTFRIQQQYKQYQYEIQLYFKNIKDQLKQRQQKLLDKSKITMQSIISKLNIYSQQINQKYKFMKDLQQIYSNLMELSDIDYLKQDNKRIFIVENCKIKKIKIQTQRIQFNGNIISNQIITMLQQHNKSKESPSKIQKIKKTKIKQPAILQVNLNQQYHKHYSSNPKPKQITISTSKILSETDKMPNLIQKNSNNQVFEEQQEKCNINESFSAVSCIQSFMDSSHASLLHSLRDGQGEFTLYPIQQRIYHFGGFSDNLIQYIKLQALGDKKNQQIQQQLKIGRNKCQCVVINSYSPHKCLILGGKSNKGGDRLDTILEYDIKTKGLSKSYLMLSEGKSGFGAVVKQSKLYIIGGSSEKPLNIFEQYRLGPSGFICKRLQNLNHTRDQLGCVLGLDNNIYVCGGINQSNTILSTCQRYNQKKQRWQPIASMNYPRRSFAIVALPSGIVVIGGHDGKNYLATVQKYTYTTGKWTNLKNLNVARCTHTAVVTNDYQYIWVSGGFRNQPLSQIEIYDVMENNWENYGNLKEQRFLHCSIITNLI